jgi:hypothetical protein
MGASGPPGGKAPPPAGSFADQAKLERSIRQPLGAEVPSSRRPSKGPRPTLTPPSFEAVQVPAIPPAPVPVFSAIDLDRVPLRRLDAEQELALHLDHRAGFILSLVDGVSGVDTVLDLCGMPRIEALSILQKLIDVGAIALR